MEGARRRQLRDAFLSMDLIGETRRTYSALSGSGIGPCLEADLGLEQKLHGIDAGIAIQRECDVGVPHIAERGAGAENAQAEADIAEPARIDGVGVLRIAPPRTAHVEEHRTAHTKQPERI